MGYAIKTGSTQYRAVASESDIDLDEVFMSVLPVNPIWDESSQLLIEKTEAQLFQDYQLKKINELKIACKATIEGGFTSDTLGTVHTYESATPQDQINVLGAKESDKDRYFTCIDSNGVKDRRLHTKLQIKAIFDAGDAHIDTNMAKFYTLKAAVEAATTIAEVDAVVW